MFRQSLRRCARIGGASFVSPSLRWTRSVTPWSITQSSRTTLRIPVIANAFRLYSSEAGTAEAAEVSDKKEARPELTTKFADLHNLGVHQNLVNTITQGMRYENMTDVQSQTIQPALKGMDLVAQAKTGTGKTLAFLVPVLQRMIMADPSLATRKARFSASSQDIRGIIISPTRELAEQIAIEAEKLCKNTGLIVQRAVGGTRKGMMLAQTRRNGCHLLVATPGRLNDLLSDPGSGIRAPNLAAIVLDEADRMLDVGFEKELRQIVQQLPDPRTSERQTLLFSATVPRNVVNLARDWVRADNFDFIQTIAEDDVLTHEKVTQHVIHCRGWGNTIPALYELMEKEIEKRDQNPVLLPFKALVFLPTSAWVDLVADVDEVMRRDRRGIRSWRIHSRLSQEQRTRSAEQFRRTDSGILFSTDVTARGLDFPNVTHVIQLGTPSDRQQYIHRLGRTGRAEKEGEGWLILPQSDVPIFRKELYDLPINPNKSIESAQFDFTSESQPSELMAKVTGITASVRESTMEDAYMSLFGQSKEVAQQKADELREWFVHGLKKENTPPMSYSSIEKRGLRRVRGLNILGRGVSSELGGSSSDSDRLGSGGSRGGFEGGGDRFAARFANRSEDRPGDRSGNRFGDRSGNRFGDRSGNRFGDRSGNRFGDRSGNRFGDRSGDSSGNRFGDRSGNRYGDRGSRGGRGGFDNRSRSSRSSKY